MSKKLSPLDYDTSWQDDMILRSLRWASGGLEDIHHDDLPRNFENITRSAYRDMERVLTLSKTERLDQLTPHFFYPLFWTDRVRWGLLSSVEQRVVSVWFRDNPFDEAGISNPQRSAIIKRIEKLGFHITRDTQIQMTRDFFQKREPTFFRDGMQYSVVTRIDNILDGACSEFPDWLRMRFGSRRDRISDWVIN